MGRWSWIVMAYVIGLGFWIRSQQFRAPLRAYAAAVIAMFLAAQVALLLEAVRLLGLQESSRRYVEILPMIGEMMASWLFTITLAVATGALWAGWWRRWRGAPASAFATRLAERLVNSNARHRANRPDAIKRVASVISAIAPILSLIGTVIAAYLNYLSGRH